MGSFPAADSLKMGVGGGGGGGGGGVVLAPEKNLTYVWRHWVTGVSVKRPATIR